VRPLRELQRKDRRPQGDLRDDAVGGADVGERDHPDIQHEVGAHEEEIWLPGAPRTKLMGMTLLLLLAALQTVGGSQGGFQPRPLRPPLDEVQLLLPAGYEEDKKVSLKWARVATSVAPDVVTVRLQYYPVKMPLTATPP